MIKKLQLPSTIWSWYRTEHFLFLFNTNRHICVHINYHIYSWVWILFVFSKWISVVWSHLWCLRRCCINSLTGHCELPPHATVDERSPQRAGECTRTGENLLSWGVYTPCLFSLGIWAFDMPRMERWPAIKRQTAECHGNYCGAPWSIAPVSRV